MTDKELLELAAKAAGISIDYSTTNGGGFGNTGFDIQGNAVLDWHNYTIWNPLRDDGDALRLAVKLGLRVECRPDGQAYVWRGDVLLWNEFALHEALEYERQAAARRAIVRTAAEIGKAMP